jgi:restriction endonuclease S subunit
MAQISVVRKSQLEGATRLDAEYYMPKYFQNEAVIGASAFTKSTLGELIYPVMNGFDYRDFGEIGHPYIRVGDVLFGEVNYRDSMRVDIPPDAIKKDVAVKVGDILFSRKGTFGRSAIVEEAFKDCVISSEIMRLRIKDERVNPYYLSTYLNSRIGFLQVERRSHGVSNYSISQRDLQDIKVAILPEESQLEIASLVKAAHCEKEHSYTLYLQAEQLLLDELGFKELDLSHQLYYTVPFKKTREANRLDAEHFQPKYEHALTLLGQSGLQVKDVAKVRKDPFKARAGQPFNYIEIGNVHSNGLADSERVLGEDAPSRATWVVHTNDVITSTVRPIRRLSALIGEEQEGYVCSSGFVVLQAAGIQAEVFLVFLRLPIVCEILDLKTKASMYPAISTDDLLDLPVAVPPKRVSQHIVQLIGDGHRAWRKARQLLEEAKSKVENLIESRA